jgi:hypothetical protein
VEASSVVVGDRLAIWDENSSSFHASNVAAIEIITGGSMYTPLTQLGMNFLLNGGALVPMDGKAAVLPGSLPNSTIPRAYVVGMASFGVQFYAAIRRLMPASWAATWTAALLAQETSVALGSCVETVHLSNLLLQAINTSSSFSNILSVIGNEAGLATWAALDLCNVLPDLCTSSSQSVSISQSGEQAGLTELSINTQAGDSIDLNFGNDPFLWLNELDGVGAEPSPPASPEGGDGGGMDGSDAGTVAGIASPAPSPEGGDGGGSEGGDGGGNDGLDLGTIAGIVVGSAVLFCFLAAAAFWVIKSRRPVQVAAVAGKDGEGKDGE